MLSQAKTAVGTTTGPSVGISPTHDWFLDLMREHEEFEVETDGVGEWPLPFWSETVRQVVAE